MPSDYSNSPRFPQATNDIIDDFVRRIAAKSQHLFALAKSDLANEAPRPAIKSEDKHPTAIELAAGIAKKGREGPIKAWRDNSRAHNFEPTRESDGSWRTCCPAHDDHTPSLVISDKTIDGQRKLLVCCRTQCKHDQNKVIETLNELGLRNCAPGTIEVPEAMKSADAASPARKPAKGTGEAIIPIPDDCPASAEQPL
jgi:hypothetical protein